MSESKVTLVVSAIINKDNMPALQEYTASIGPIFGQVGATPISKFKTIEQVRGNEGPDVVAIFEFESADAIKGMMEGELFQSLNELRNQAFTKLDMMICENA